MQRVNHPVLGTLNATITPVGEDPDGQVAGTIALMRQYVVEDKDSPLVATAVQEALRMTPDPIEAVFRYVKGRVRFVYDAEIASPWGSEDIVEVLIRPVDMLALGSAAQGDCDDYVMLAAAMLMHMGVEVRFVTIAADKRDTSRYSHVYLAAYEGGRRIVLDTSHGPYAGWEAPPERVYKIREWPLDGVVGNPLAAIFMLGAIYYAVRRYA